MKNVAPQVISGWDGWVGISLVLKMTGETPEVRSDKRKPRMLLRHRTS